jgi:hypothetical protein
MICAGAFDARSERKGKRKGKRNWKSYVGLRLMGHVFAEGTFSTNTWYNSWT